ncbi:hypothetical protein [Nocardia sp. NPDC004604]|uniref:YunG family protein n=1 Tax=Nocardia sp. NPDC004604 TaxID=3157013 RepID=UPI0033B81185
MLIELRVPSVRRYPAPVVVVSRQALEHAVQAVWSAMTSSASDWTERNPAKGQCAVTACVVQDYFGGNILNSIATLPSGETVSHYFNIIDSETVDLTRAQFPPGTSFSAPEPKTKGFPSTRDYCLSFDRTRQRYDVLSSRVFAYLQAKE